MVLQSLEASPFLEHFRASPLGQAVGASPELAKVAFVDKMLRENLGINLTQLRDDILGDAVVLAYRPGDRGQEPAAR